MATLIETVQIVIDNKADSVLLGLPIYTKNSPINIQGKIAADVYNRFDINDDGNTAVLTMEDSDGVEQLSYHFVKEDFVNEGDGWYSFDSSNIAALSILFSKEDLYNLTLSVKDDLENVGSESGTILYDITPPVINKVEVINPQEIENVNYLGDLDQKPTTANGGDVYYNNSEGVAYIYTNGNWEIYEKDPDKIIDNENPDIDSYIFTQDPGNYITLKIYHDESVTDGEFMLYKSKDDMTSLPEGSYSEIYKVNGEIPNPLIVNYTLPTTGDNDVIELTSKIKDRAGNASIGKTVEVVTAINPLEAGELSSTLSNSNEKVVDHTTIVKIDGSVNYPELVDLAELVIYDNNGEEIDRETCTGEVKNNKNFTVQNNNDSTLAGLFGGIIIPDGIYTVNLELTSKTGNKITTNNIIFIMDSSAPIINIKQEYKNNIKNKLQHSTNTTTVPLIIEEKNIDDNVVVYCDDILVSINDGSDVVLENEDNKICNVNLPLSLGVHNYKFKITDKTGKTAFDSMQIEYKRSAPKIYLEKDNTNAIWDPDQFMDSNGRTRLRTTVNEFNCKILLENDWETTGYSTEHVTMKVDGTIFENEFIDNNGVMEANFSFKNLTAEQDQNKEIELLTPFDFYTNTPSGVEDAYEIQTEQSSGTKKYKFNIGYDQEVFFNVDTEHYTTTTNKTIRILSEDYIDNSNITISQKDTDSNSAIVGEITENFSSTRNVTINLEDLDPDILKKEYNFEVFVTTESGRTKEQTFKISQYNLGTTSFDISILDKDLDLVLDDQPLINKIYNLKFKTPEPNSVERILIDHSDEYQNPPEDLSLWTDITSNETILGDFPVDESKLEGYFSKKIFIKISEVPEPIILNYEYLVDFIPANSKILGINNNSKTSKYMELDGLVSSVLSNSKYNNLQKTEIYVNGVKETTIKAHEFYSYNEIDNKNNIKELRAYSSELITNDLVLVRNTLSYYKFDQASLETDNSKDVIKPNHIDESDQGRWIKTDKEPKNELPFIINRVDNNGDYGNDPKDITIIEEGYYDIYAKTTDVAGNISETEIVTIEINNSVPTINIINQPVESIKKDFGGYSLLLDINSENCTDGTIYLEANLTKVKKYNNEEDKNLVSLDESPIKLFQGDFDFKNNIELQINSDLLLNKEDALYYLEITGKDDLGNPGTTGIYKVEIYNQKPKLKFFDAESKSNFYFKDGFANSSSIETKLTIIDNILGIDYPVLEYINESEKNNINKKINYNNASKVEFYTTLLPGTNNIKFVATNSLNKIDILYLDDFNPIMFDSINPKMKIKRVISYKEEDGKILQKNKFRFVDNLFLNGRLEDEFSYIEVDIMDQMFEGIDQPENIKFLELEIVKSSGDKQTFILENTDGNWVIKKQVGDQIIEL